MTSSSETQGQLVGAGKSLNGREKKSGEEKSRTALKRKKNWAKKSQERLFLPFLTFLRQNFFLFRLDFFPPPLVAPGSPRMRSYQIALMHLSAAIPGGWPRGTPGHLHPDICKFYLTRANILRTKTYHYSSPGEHNLKGLPNCNVISYIIHTVSKST